MSMLRLHAVYPRPQSSRTWGWGDINIDLQRLRLVTVFKKTSSLGTGSVNDCISASTDPLYSYCRQSQRQVWETEPTNGNLMVQVSMRPCPSLDHSEYESAPTFTVSLVTMSSSTSCMSHYWLCLSLPLSRYTSAFKLSNIMQDVLAQRVWTHDYSAWHTICGMVGGPTQ